MALAKIVPEIVKKVMFWYIGTLTRTYIGLLPCSHKCQQSGRLEYIIYLFLYLTLPCPIFHPCWLEVFR
jgi:hypothetical protein